MALYRSPLTVTLWPSSFLKNFTPNAAVLFVDVAIQPEVRFIAKQNSLMKIGNNDNLVLGPFDESIQVSTEKSLNDVRSQVKSAYQSNSAITDIDVTFDGTWLTRGHSSQIGVGCMIDLLTGFFMDFLKLSQNTALNVNTQNLVWEKIQQNFMCGMKALYLHVQSIT
ncbi:uncharacterized protein TNCV_140251 [Trichonephila clavipes]|uniref:Uncharacterized protein n=1 Tax=Trichonephila clavipes TaxID=2585209 RepID=A0A8X6RK77_TRICX|nr:uncharacterized protein TNCV_140251 [Trichonephila clavipes]